MVGLHQSSRSDCSKTKTKTSGSAGPRRSSPRPRLPTFDFHSRAHDMFVFESAPSLRRCATEPPPLHGVGHAPPRRNACANCFVRTSMPFTAILVTEPLWRGKVTPIKTRSYQWCRPAESYRLMLDLFGVEPEEDIYMFIRCKLATVNPDSRRLVGQFDGGKIGCGRTKTNPADS